MSEMTEESLFASLSITSWVSWSNFAKGFSRDSSPFGANETIKFTPNFDFSEMVGLVSSAEIKIYRLNPVLTRITESIKYRYY